MSKSLGNLVFVDALRKEWDPMAIRLGDHRAPLPHGVGVGRRADAPLGRPARRVAARPPAGGRATCSTPVRDALDDDLDTPTAFAAIDAAAARGDDVRAAAELLGVDCALTSPAFTDLLTSTRDLP